MIKKLKLISKMAAMPVSFYLFIAGVCNQFNLFTWNYKQLILFSIASVFWISMVLTEHFLKSFNNEQND